MTGCISCWLKACGLYGADGRVAEAVAEIAGDAEDLDGSGSGDAEANGDSALDMELDGFSGVLGTRLEENFRRGFGDGGRAGGLGHGRRSVLAEIDGACDSSCGVEWTGAAGDAELDAANGVGGGGHVSAGGGAGAQADGFSAGAVVGGGHSSHATVAEIDGAGGRTIRCGDGIGLLAKSDRGGVRRWVHDRSGLGLRETDDLRRRRRLDELGRRGDEDGRLLHHLDLGRLGEVGELDVGELDFWGIDLDDGWRRKLGDDLGLDGLDFGLLGQRSEAQLGELVAVIHGLLRGGADDADDDGDDDVKRDRSEERTLALAAVIEDAEV